MTNIKLTINKDDFKKKLNIKDGENGLPGKNGKDAPVVDTSKLALEASKIAIDEIKPLIPIIIPETPEQTVDKVNLSKTKVRKEAIEGLADIERMARENAVPVTTSFFNGNRAKNLNIVGGVATQQGDTVSIDSTVFNDDRYVNVTGDTMSGALTLANLTNALNSANYPVQMMSGIADGASAVGYSFDTTNALANATAKILKLSAGGSEKLTILGNGNVGIGSTTPISKLDIVGTITEGTISSEMIINSVDRGFTGSLGNWVAGTNWVYAALKAQHNTGVASTLTLPNNMLTASPTAGNVYIISYQIRTTTVGVLTISFGGTNGSTLGASIDSIAFIDSQTIVATNTGVLTFSADATWAGTIDNVSVKLITASDATEILKNSDSTIGNELRSGGTGKYNTFNGTNAGMFNSTGLYNTAIGDSAMKYNSSASANTLIGYKSGYANTSGSSNTAIGANTLISNTSGSFNTVLGGEAGYSNTTGGNNLFLGYQSGKFNVNGSSNMAIGAASLYSNTTGSSNAAIGYEALRLNTSGSFNTAIGRAAGYDTTTGSYNIHIGTLTYGLAATNSSIAIGYSARNTANNQLIIGSADTNGSITDAYFGQGVVKVTPTGITINPTGGSGTNNVGASLTIAGGKSTGNALGGSIIFSTANVGASGTTLQSITEKARFLYNGNFGLGVAAPTAVLHLKAGTATASTAPLKFNSGALNTAAEAGAVEFLTDNYYATITTGAKRKTIEFQENYSQSFLLMGA